MESQTKWSMFAFGAFGGVLPTLANLGSVYVTTPNTPLPAFGLLFGLILYAVVGGGVALTNTSPETRQAIMAGIAAPAIIMSIVSGASEAGMRRKTVELVTPIGVLLGLMLPSVGRRNSHRVSTRVLRPLLLSILL